MANRVTGGQTNDTDRMERTALEELGLERAGVAPPVPVRPRARWATPPAVPKVNTRPGAAPVVVNVRELAPLTRSAWGYVERIHLAAPAAAPVTVVATPSRGHLHALAAGGIVAVAITIAAVTSLSRGGSAETRVFLPSSPVAGAAAVDREPAEIVANQIGEPTVTAEAEDFAPSPAVVVSPISTAVMGRFTTEPVGALVTLVDDGEARALGPSPVSVELDREHTYELLVEHPGHWGDVRLIVLDPREDKSDSELPASIHEHVELTAQSPASEAPALAAKGAGNTSARVAAKRAPIRKLAKSLIPKRSTRKLNRPAKGTLMLHAKPPCDIEIDGRDTGLTTPRRDIKLLPGKHRITLINREHKIRENLTVTIRAGRSVRVSRDLTSRL